MRCRSRTWTSDRGQARRSRRRPVHLAGGGARGLLLAAVLAGPAAGAEPLLYVDDTGTEVYHSLNPEGLEWSYALDRLHPISGWHVDVRAGQKALTLAIAPRHLEDVRERRAADRPIRLEVQLQALRDERGRVAALEEPREAFLSRQLVGL